MLIFQWEDLMNAWLLVLSGKVEYVIPFALRRIVVVMTLSSTSLFGDRVHQSQGNDLGFIEVLVLEAHILILLVCASRPVA